MNSVRVLLLLVLAVAAAAAASTAAAAKEPATAAEEPATAAEELGSPDLDAAYSEPVLETQPTTHLRTQQLVAADSADAGSAAHQAKHLEHAHGRKAAKFNQKKGHKKGHNTKGYHNKYHKDEYHKEHKFYDDYHKSGSHDRRGLFRGQHSAQEHGHRGAHARARNRARRPPPRVSKHSDPAKLQQGVREQPGRRERLKSSGQHKPTMTMTMKPTRPQKWAQS